MDSRVQRNIEDLHRLCSLWGDKEIKLGVSFDTLLDLRRNLPQHYYNHIPPRSDEYKYIEYLTLETAGRKVTIFAQDDVQKMDNCRL